MSPRTLYAVAAAVTAALLIALAIDLLTPGYHRTTANGRMRTVVANMPPGARLCQPGQTIEAGTGRVRFHAKGVTRRVGPLDVEVQSGGKVIGRGRVAPHPLGFDILLAASFGRVPRRLSNASICIVNRGTGMQLLGEPIGGKDGAAQLPPASQPVAFMVLTLDYQLAGKKSWLSFAPTVAERYSFVKATFFGPWTFWLAMAVLVVMAIGTIWWTARTVAR